MSVRRSPTHYKPALLPYAGKVNGYAPAPLPAGARGGRGCCARVLQWLLPLLAVALLSSYATYLVLYSAAIGTAIFPPNGGSIDAADQQRLPLGQQLLRAPALAAQQRATAAAAMQASLARAAAAAEAAAQPDTQALPRLQPGDDEVPPPRRPGEPPPLAPPDAATRWLAATAGRRLRVALVNHAPYHLEIVAGFLHVLSQLPVDVTWYQAGQSVPGYSPVQLMEVTGFGELLGYLPHMLPLDTGRAPEPADFAVLVSPEYFEALTADFLRAARPITVVALGHNGMNRALQRLQALHPRMHFAALAPHVATAMREVLHIHTHWMMATMPVNSSRPCPGAAPGAAACSDGFSIQGNFEPARRNYTRMWAQLQDGVTAHTLPPQAPARPMRLHLLGRGDVHSLGIPESVVNLTAVHSNLKFTQYYEQIAATHALLMLLGSDNYLRQKMSSTVVSSLMTGVPVIADAAVLHAYTFLAPGTAFVMGPGESELDVMLRVLRMPTSDVQTVHNAVRDLAAQLNRRTLQVLQQLMPLPEDAAKAQTGQLPAPL